MNLQLPSIYASPPAQLRDYADLAASFYHATDLPDGVTTPGVWDLRGRVDDYLGNVDFSGKRVLEIGPASGFLTMEMERRGADVVALDIPEAGNWDFVPFPDDAMTGIREHRFSDMRYIRNTWWFTHRAFGLKARAAYADAYNLPAELGTFDVALLAAVLLHTSNPQRIVAECASRANTIIVTDLAYDDLERIGDGIISLLPTADNKRWDTWWRLSSSFFIQYLGVLGFPHQTVTFHQQHHVKSCADHKYFTVVGSR